MTMRWIAGSLILVNFGFWMWHSWYFTPGNPVPPPPARAEVAPEQLKSLRKVAAPPAELGRNAHPAKDLVDVTPPRVCYQLGPFRTAKTIDQARRKVLPLAVSAVPRETEEQRKIYRVYIPSLSSAAAVREMRASLTRNGFRDHAVLSEKGRENAISLGVYSIKSNATNMLRKLKKKKFKAEMETQSSTRIRRWLDVKTATPLSDEFRQAWSSGGVEVREVACGAQVLAGEESGKP